MANSLVEKIKDKNKLIAFVVRHKYTPDGLSFISRSLATQQIGIMQHPAGHTIQKAIHKPIVRKITGTAKTLIIVTGVVEVDLYNNRRKYIKTVVLSAGDLICLESGGHGFRFIKKSKVIEIKQGPYISKDDKDRF